MSELRTYFADASFAITHGSSTRPETPTQNGAKVVEANGSSVKPETNGSSARPETNGNPRVLFMDTPNGVGERARIISDAMRHRGMKPGGATRIR